MQKKPRILLIDDDHDFVEATKTVLESRPYEVITAFDGDDGFNKAKKQRPDLVLLDIIMPVKDGFSAIEQFRKDPQLKKVPILMLTSFSQKGMGTSLPRGRGLELQADDYLEKPVSPTDLLATVEKHLKKAGF